MPNDKWNDEEIENLLRDFPEIKDQRPKAEVYKQLIQDKPTTKQPKRWLPLLVAIVAFFSISVLVVSLLQQNGTDSSVADPSGKDEQSMMTIDQADQEEAVEQQTQPDETAEPEGESAATSFENEALRTAVYESDLSDHQLFRIGLTHLAYVVPVSFMISNEQANGAESSVELYEQFAEQVDEVGLGFDDYHPFAGYFEQGNERLNHYLPNDHPYDEGSASTLLYLSSLEETFMDQQEIRILNDQGEAAEFSHLGVAGPVVPDEQGQSFYVLSSAKEAYLAPAYGMSEAQPQEALMSLKISPNDDYSSPIPVHINYAAEQQDDAVAIEFDEPLDLLSLDEQEAMTMIESMALTAASYGVSLQFENIVQDQWGGFDFAGPIELPVSANRMDWPQK
ncbi:hypothetical protein [Planococcus dechangensis]|uniref:GerMN domain-containing protein n=1 Tax=Planococcus dechangensis TaxID=1176255 RepID=A0ABV9MCQ7_9BACL